MLDALKLIACRGVCTLAVLSCGAVVGSDTLHEGERIDPPAVYTVWWEMAQACSGRSGSLHDIQWYEAASIRNRGDGHVLAYWSGADNTVVVLSSARLNGRIVRHEMLHALLRSSGHPRSMFLEKCAGVVACTGECVDEAGPAPPVPDEVPRAPPSALTVTVTVAPQRPANDLNEGYFSVTVRARNDAPHPVVVQLPPTEGGGPPVSFSYSIRNTGGPGGDLGSVPAVDAGSTSFAAGETKLHVFDFFIATFNSVGGRLQVQYEVTGAYGGHVSREQELTIP